ncbi:MAG: dihydroorotate dehydrogenase [Acidobacteria bacterium]|nr:dihydroorotate dehydrogenase [Acidobacteriota bacterium]
MRLEVDVGRGLVLKNPILTASGTFGYGLEFEPFLNLGRLGGLVVKGISPRPRAGNPPARIVETPAGMLNAIGLQNVGVRRFIDEKLPALRERDTAVVVNVYGHSTEDYVAVAEALEPERGVAALELNLSCPNVKEGGQEIGRSPRLIEEVTAAVRRASSRPLWVKLTPNVGDIVACARAAADGGADAVSLINTLVGMVIDVERRRPVLSHGTGGLSGPAIRPVAIAMVWQVARALRIPVIGMGGIVSARDVVEFLLAGARAVQVGTANFNDPGIALRILDDLATWCRVHGVTDVNELVGAAEGAK